MTKQDNPHAGQIEECKSVFVSWKAGMGYIITVIAVVCTAVYIYATTETKQNDMLSDHEARMQKVEYTNHSLDTIKILLRSKTR